MKLVIRWLEQITINMYRNKPLLFGCLTLACYGSIMLTAGSRHVFADTALSISSEAPMIDSGDRFENYDPVSVGPLQPWISIASGTAKAPNAWLKVYVPIGKSTSVTIQNGNGWCLPVSDPILGPVTGQDQWYPDVTYRLVQLDANEEIPAVPVPGSYTATANNLTSGTGCANLTLPAIGAGKGVASNIDGHSGFRVFFFSAILNNGCAAETTACTYHKAIRVCARAVGVPGADDCTKRIGDNGSLVGFSRSVSC